MASPWERPASDQPLSEESIFPKVEQEKEDPMSRFGDTAAIDRLLASTPDSDIKLYPDSLEEVFDKLIPNHLNRVELARLVGPEKGASGVIPASIRMGGGDSDILAIFKPCDGENNHLSKLYQRPAFAPYEEMAYLVSEHFKLDLVPSTKYRMVHNRPGSLQLFMSPFHYGAGGYVYGEDGQLQSLWNNPDYQAMGALDFLILNPDRHANNFLVKGELEGVKHDPVFDLEEPSYHVDGGNSQLIAIDHGLAFSPNIFKQYNMEQRHLGGYQGPLRTYTADTVRVSKYEQSTRRRRQDTPISDEVLEKLERGLRDRERLESAIYDVYRRAEGNNLHLDIRPDLLLDQMWQRCDALVTSKIYLSPHNTYDLPAGSTYEARDKHPSIRATPLH